MGQQFSFLKSVNAGFIDDLYEDYKKNPDSVEASWRGFFEGVGFGTELSKGADSAETALALAAESECAELINAYRADGRLLANIDPLSKAPDSHPLLDPARFNLQETDKTKVFQAARLIGLEPSTLDQIIARLREIYCSSIGVQFSHIQDAASREWLINRMESTQNREQLSADDKKFILKRLTEAESWETFLHTRYVAKKRFSLEGGEALIPLLDRVIEVGAELGADHYVMGMAHRGRLNVLTNIFGKKADYIFGEFEESYLSSEAPDHPGIGDVKYHMGFSANIVTRQGRKVHMSLGHNPSHLEFINPVIVGIARSKQRLLNNHERDRVVPIQIHGDAAFAGQGVVYETLNLSQVSGFKTGGSIHIVINNQVGFTTDPSQARSTAYATDIAKMLDAPIFHVNGDDPEAVSWVSRLAMEYRQQFKRDVFIDLICYRKYGHNEGDEPAFTQPLMYKNIKDHPTPRTIYADRLLKSSVVSENEVQAMMDQSIQSLTESQNKARLEKPKPYSSAFMDKWQGFVPARESNLYETIPTAVEEKKLKELSKKLNTLPASFTPNPKLGRFFEARLKAVEEGKGLDWGNAEALAYASLLVEGHRIRLTGQDVERGTFTHRHAVLSDYNTGEKYCPHNHLSSDQLELNIKNSILSETAVLGFEYGWSLTDPNALVIWEAQFGDFANGAQVIIDQFLSSSEIKWKRSSGLVLFLPHGFEGQGPEHSSARLERFLQLCGDSNMSVCNLSTPAQLFHALRRQVKRKFRQPLVIMTPKKLLRYPAATSELKDLSQGSFQSVIDDPTFEGKDKKSVHRVILCSGKIYYELMEERQAQGITDIALVRMEEIFPWPAERLKNILTTYPQAEIVWAQEEPRNQGAWTHVFNYWAGGIANFSAEINSRPIRYVGRKVAGAPASGSEKAHLRIQSDIVKSALAAHTKA